MRPAPSGRRRLTARLVALVAVLALAGCGGDDENSAETTPALPELTVPQGERTEPVEPLTETTPAPPPATEPAPPSTGGGTPAPEAVPPQDTPDNDTPPPADSPAERFEDFCNENPGACG